MLYRAASIAIVAFWLVMMGLLIRLEINPGASDILDVPVSYVLRLMFSHGEQSLLTVRQGTIPIGAISLRPSVSGSASRILDFSGTLSIPQRLNFSGTLDMNAALRLRDFHFEVGLRQPQWRLEATGDTTTNRLAYDIRVADQRIASQSVPMNPAAIGSALARNLGLDMRALPIPAGITPPIITAREVQITLRGDQMQVYEVTISEASSPVIDFDVSQLGQVVQAKSNFGYNLTTEDWQ